MSAKANFFWAWYFYEEFIERTVSFIFERDQSHPRVTEPEIPDSTRNVSHVPGYGQDWDQEEIHHSLGSPDRRQDQGGATAGQVGHYQGADAHFVVEEEPGPLEDDLLDSNGLHKGEMSLSEDSYDQSTTRTGQEDRREGLRQTHLVVRMSTLLSWDVMSCQVWTGTRKGRGN